MQFAVPQFTDVEDTIIGSLTLKQFFALLAGGGVILFFWSVGLPGIIFFPLAFIIAVSAVGITFGTYNGRKVFSYIIPFVSFSVSSKTMIFKREEDSLHVSHTVVKSVSDPSLVVRDSGEDDSRLKKLAYLLDQKVEEEKQLTSH